MLVKHYMTRHPIMIGSHRRVVDAQRLMVENHIRHLPVVGDGKRLLGLVTRQRLKISPEKLSNLGVWEITNFLSDLTVDKVMVKGSNLVAIDAQSTLEEAAALMTKRKISGLPVVEDRDIVAGILTETDLLQQFQQLLGANDPGMRLTVRVPTRRGEFGRLYSSIIDKGWVVMAMGSIRSPKIEHHWDIMIKVLGASREELEALVAGLGGEEILDLRETTVYTT